MRSREGLAMLQLRTAVGVSYGLGLLSLLAILACHAALTDIWHGEADVAMEWRVLQVSFAIIIAFQLSALLTLRRVLQDKQS